MSITPFDPTGLNDAELVRLSLRDNRNFRILIERYEAKFTAYIYRISGLHPDDAADILQDAFIKIYQNLTDFDLRLKFSSWAYRIVRNQTFDYLRKIKARPQLTIDDWENTIWQKIINTTDLPTKIDTAIAVETVRHLLKKLSPKYQEVLELYFWEQKTYEEIADILHCTTGTVGALIFRAKKKIKQTMETYDESK